MKAIGKEVGEAIEPLFREVESRLRVESERALRLEPFDGVALSDIDWEEPGAVVVSLHSGVPTHALAHVLGVALQHLRQRLDRYPEVIPGEAEFEGGLMLRHALRDVVLGPEAEARLAPLGLDARWEAEQRHQGLKDVLRGTTKEWDNPLTPDHAFGALLYARFALDHPPEMWEGLRRDFARKLPAVSETGERVVQLVREHGWNSPGACLESLVAVRDELGMIEIALIEDRRTGTVV